MVVDAGVAIGFALALSGAFARSVASRMRSAPMKRGHRPSTETSSGDGVDGRSIFLRVHSAYVHSRIGSCNRIYIKYTRNSYSPRDGTCALAGKLFYYVVLYCYTTL